MIRLQAGEQIWVYTKVKGKNARMRKHEIVGFSVLGIQLKERGILHFSSGLFYGFGYHTDGFCIYLKETDRDLLKSALLMEKARQSLPEELSKKLNLER